ncbi:hypothetical protein LQ236_000626 [Nitrospina gracilis]|uniref:hypothetical protein n=2 Tax=Nitrospina TaxID=35800 RepID=UPI001F329FDE|nr:hypothetical protein [Nitrospina sp. Nb-3]MCF8722606.1 hypothetical protein [Nitrospina sp. Nb-3]
MTNEPPSPKGSFVLRIYTVLNVSGVVVLLLAVMEHGFENHHPLFDVGAPLGLVILFFLIPLGWLGVWLAKRKSAASVPLPQRYLLISNLFLGAMWMLSCVVVGLYAFIYISFLPQPWLASDQGPDTPAAQLEFEKYFGVEPGGGVRNLYHLHSPEMALFRFDLEDDTPVLTAVKEAKKMVPQTGPCPMNLANPPEWWGSPETSYSGECFGTWAGKDRANPIMRVHPDSGRVFFMDFRP